MGVWVKAMPDQFTPRLRVPRTTTPLHASFRVDDDSGGMRKQGTPVKLAAKVVRSRPGLGLGSRSCEEAMAVLGKRMYLDFVARDYTSNYPKFEVVSGSHKSSAGTIPVDYVAWKKGKEFTLRCYLSLQGEDGPAVSSTRLSSP